jgi:putative inorganic carbon (HCO3(-)) transporter
MMALHGKSSALRRPLALAWQAFAWLRRQWGVLAILALGGLLGAFLPIYSEMTSGSLSALVAIPALLVLMCCIAYDRKFLLIMILLLRASGDVFLESTRIGGLINVAVVMLATLLVLEQPRLFPRRHLAPWAIFLALCVFGVVMSPLKFEALRVLIAQMSYFSMFVAAFYMVRKPEDLQFYMKILLASSVIPVLYSFVDYALHHAEGGGAYRIRSTFSHANIFAFYLTLMIGLTFYMFKQASARRDQFWRSCGWVLYLLVLLALLVGTRTRSAWMACFLMFFVYAVFFERRYLLYMVLFGVLGLFMPGVADRISDLGSGNQVGTYAKLNSYAWRVYLWESGLNWMRPSDFVLGRGLQAFKDQVIYFFPLSSGVNWNAHSVYVQLIYETGIVGLLCYLRLYYSALRQLFAMIKLDRLAAFVVLMAVFNFLLAAYSDNLLDYLNFNWYLWFLIGAGCAYVSVAKPAADAAEAAAKAEAAKSPPPGRYAPRAPF